ncbi:MAG: hypothetical protein Q9159_000915 [Coniocarpon cinnabarinum]
MSGIFGNSHNEIPSNSESRVVDTTQPTNSLIAKHFEIIKASWLGESWMIRDPARTHKDHQIFKIFSTGVRGLQVDPRNDEQDHTPVFTTSYNGESRSSTIQDARGTGVPYLEWAPGKANEYTVWVPNDKEKTETTVSAKVQQLEPKTHKYRITLEGEFKAHYDSFGEAMKISATMTTHDGKIEVEDQKGRKAHVQWHSIMQKYDVLAQPGMDYLQVGSSRALRSIHEWQLT